MNIEPADPLPPEIGLALAWSGPSVRAPLNIAFQLDRRLARIVARTTEPMLGQMRLAWWRDALGKPAAQRPAGDAVLDAISRHWHGREPALAQMVDAWEVLVTAEHVGAEEATRFGAGRGAFFAALATGPAASALRPRLLAAGHCWAVADASLAVTAPAERGALIESGKAAQTRIGRIGGEWRGLAVLGALAARSLDEGGQPLMNGRRASLTAYRAAIFGA